MKRNSHSIYWENPISCHFQKYKYRSKGKYAASNFNCFQSINNAKHWLSLMKTDAKVKKIDKNSLGLGQEFHMIVAVLNTRTNITILCN